MPHEDERYIANSASAFGVAYSEYDAVVNWASHASVDPDDTQTVQIAKVEGEVEMGPGVINAETEHRYAEYEVDGEAINDLAASAAETEVLAETLLVEADEKDTDDA